MTRFLGVAFFLGVAAGCAVDDGGVVQYGQMRAVLHEGESQPRMALARVTAAPHAHAVGALAGLAGEVTVLDGRAIVSRVREGALQSGPPEPEDSATLLTLAHVDRWESATLEAAADAALEQAVRNMAAARGVETARPFPFVIEGEVTSLDMHVINGACPSAGREGDGHAPWRMRLAAPARATLVGFYAENREGEMTHHGSNVHWHAVLDHGGQTITGHVETVAVGKGAIIRIPQAR